jgi:dephospho-CoA kinase
VLTIGLTGGIGSGKSTVAVLLVELGARLIDADKIGHEIYLPETPGWSRVVEAFGREILATDGTIDRRVLGARVFADPNALRELNAIVHPLIAKEIRSRIDAFRNQDSRTPVVVEAAVLVEAGWHELVDQVWLVVATRELAIERLLASRPLALEDIERRISSQLSDAERERVADVVLRNAGSLAELRAAVRQAWQEQIAE